VAPTPCPAFNLSLTFRPVKVAVVPLMEVPEIVPPTMVPERVRLPVMVRFFKVVFAIPFKTKIVKI